MYNWAVVNTDIVWTADGTIENDVVEAIGHWELAFPELGWATSIDASKRECGVRRAGLRWSNRFV